jgi:hypothetical protein
MIIPFIATPLRAVRATAAVTCFAATIIATSSGAVERESGNEVFMMECNSSGFILTSRQSGEKLYLGKSCDAFHTRMGAGTWCWANGGFVAELANGRVGFPRQETYCPTNDNLGVNCRC